MSPVGQRPFGSPSGPQVAPATIADANDTAPTGLQFLTKHYGAANSTSPQTIGGTECFTTITSDEYAWQIDRLIIVTLLSIVVDYDLVISTGNESRASIVEVINDIQHGSFTIQEIAPIRLGPNTNINFHWVAHSMCDVQGYAGVYFGAGTYSNVPYGHQ